MIRFAFLLMTLFAFSGLSAETVLITGANRGIGLEFARQYQERGYTVIGTARNLERAAKLRALGVWVEQLDVADPGSVEALAMRLQGVSIDLLINNAGILKGRYDSFEEMQCEDLMHSFTVNAAGPLRVTRALLPNLRKGEGKKVVQISSQFASIQNNRGGMYAYRASKTALNQLNKTMSVALGPEGFLLVVMHPGSVRTDMAGPNAALSPEESVSDMIHVIDNLNPQSNGRFFDLRGNELPW